MDGTAYIGASPTAVDSKILVSHNRSGISDACALAVDGSGEEQLTFSETEAIRALSYFSEDERVLYTADQSGNDLNHHYVRELDSEVVDLIPSEELHASLSGTG